MERERGRFRDRADQEEEGGELKARRIANAGGIEAEASATTRVGGVDRFEDSRVGDCVIAHKQDEGAQDHSDVADHVHHERLAGCEHRGAALVPEADQEVRAEADHRPPDDQEDEVPGQYEQQHREDEDVHVGEEPRVARVVLVLHIADRVGDDERTNTGDDQAHEDREVVEQQVERHLERAALDPGPVGEVALGAAEEKGERGGKRSPYDSWSDDHRHAARQPPPAAGEQESACGRQQKHREGELARAHPFISLSSSTSSTSRTWKMSTRIASPTTASAAATVIDISANSWPSMFCSWRENTISVRLTALSTSSTEMRMTSGLRRTSTPPM